MKLKCSVGKYKKFIGVKQTENMIYLYLSPGKSISYRMVSANIFQIVLDVEQFKWKSSGPLMLVIMLLQLQVSLKEDVETCIGWFA